MSRKRTGVSLGPGKGTVKKLVWGLVLLVLVVWIVKQPYEARDGLHQVLHALSVLFSGWGGGSR